MNRTEILDNIFPGDSEMAQLMRAFDWSTSAAGMPETWPESLKAAARICVGSRNPIVIWWGKTALSQIYNDGYMRILTAAKHPQWLGRSGAECWSEIMETMGPLWEQVMTTGEATWFEDFLYIMNRNLPHEECFFTFSYSALRNDSGVIDGILCICYETTSSVIGNGRLRTLRDLARTVAIAKSPEDACALAAEVLEANPQDIPFSLLYLVEPVGKQARLIASSGFADEGEAARLTINLASQQNYPWPVQRGLASESVLEIDDLPGRFGPLPGGSWPESPERALIVPLHSAGRFRGFLMAGLSTRRIVDANYRDFLDLVAGHISTAIANASALQEEGKRAEARAEAERLEAAEDSKEDLTVSDTGIGVKGNELLRFFERFHRTNAPRERISEETGIGLALVRELVQLQGGTIEAESTPGQGCTFTVSLPIAQDHVPPEPLGNSDELVDGTGIPVKLNRSTTPGGLWPAIGLEVGERERKHVEEARRLAEEQYFAHLEEKFANRTSELQNRVAERDAQLKEVHHRVKNNLHVVISMLEMQARRTDDFATFRRLNEACNRVLSIAQIYEVLYLSDSFAGVDLKAYAAKLVPQLVAFYNMQDRVVIAVEGEPLTMDLDRAVRCGLLLAELVANTCKHAFPRGGCGSLTVQLSKADGCVRLIVEDSGIGLPADFAIGIPRTGAHFKP
jgi:two-component sensor histidine kinase